MISGYRPANKEETIVNVEVNRPGSKVLLVLTSYEKIDWKVSATPSTTISGIIISGYTTPTVITSISTQGYIVKLPYAYETENKNFKDLLTTLNGWFDINKVDVFRGSYAIPSVINISALDPPRDELTLSGPSPKKPNKNFTFNLITTNFKKVVWTLTGPVHKGEESYIGEGHVAISPSGKDFYRLKNEKLEVSSQLKDDYNTILLPPNFPDFSHAMDIAYDTKRDIVSVVTSGGEGFLYRFDAKKKQWIDFRSVSNIDIYSLAYDRSLDRYVAWTDHGNLLFISGDGNLLFVRKVLDKLDGFGRLYRPYDHYNGPSPRLTIVTNGNDVALIYIKNTSVKNIWYYNVENDTAILTYRN